MTVNKRIAYGESSFKGIIETNGYYVDKTKYIEQLDKISKYNFYIRPRRFGKSLMLTMLETYYDITLSEDDFIKYFKGLHVENKNNRTYDASNYLVLSLNFSTVSTSEKKEDLMKSFNNEVYLKAQNFLDKYSMLLGGVTGNDLKNTEAVEILKYLIKVLQQNDKKMYLLIDEYDNFANRIMFSDEKLYHALSHENGDIKTFFATIKAGTQEGLGVIAKLFMTGVTPILLDDLTSGANMFTNATGDFRVNSMLGFTEDEVNKIVSDFEVGNIVDVEKFKDTLREYANGYRFSEESENTIYNTDMVLYLIKSVVDTRKLPKNLIDENIKTDYTRVRKIAENFDTADELTSIVRDGKETKAVNIISKFSLESLKNEDEGKDKFYSLLFYLGLLTIDKADADRVILKIPNQSMKKLFYEYIRKLHRMDLSTDTLEVQDAIKEMCKDGKMDFFMKLYRKIRLERVDRDDMKFYNELDSKLIMLMMMGTSSLYQILNEHELNGRFCDLYLKEAFNYDYYVNYRYVIEFKHVSKRDKTKKQIEKEVAQKLQEAKDQIAIYVEDNDVKSSTKPIKKLAIVTIGRDEEVFELY